MKVAPNAFGLIQNRFFNVNKSKMYKLRDKLNNQGLLPMSALRNAICTVAERPLLGSLEAAWFYLFTVSPF